MITRRAYEETKHKTSKEFIEWIKDIVIVEDTIQDLYEAQRIKSLLEIEEEKYTKDGVGENDIFIIAIAKRLNSILVTNEKRQPNKGKILKKNYKIPAVCDLQMVKVESINFRELLLLNP